MTNEEFIKNCQVYLPVNSMGHAKNLIVVAAAIKNERKVHDDCYCDCNAGSCPCAPCSKRIEITDMAIENLERE